MLWPLPTLITRAPLRHEDGDAPPFTVSRLVKARLQLVEAGRWRTLIADYLADLAQWDEQG
eukprot:10670332-Lingulodinium_polyedra.AAC.1